VRLFPIASGINSVRGLCGIGIPDRVEGRLCRCSMGWKGTPSPCHADAAVLKYRRVEKTWAYPCEPPNRCAADVEKKPSLRLGCHAQAQLERVSANGAEHAQTSLGVPPDLSVSWERSEAISAPGFEMKGRTDPESAALRREFIALGPPAAGVLRTPGSEQVARVPCWSPQSAKLPTQVRFGPAAPPFFFLCRGTILL